MLRLGSNEYELVRAYSGFRVTLLPKGEDPVQRHQIWELEAHYVPAESRYTPRADNNPEYLEFSIRSEDYKVADWRQLTGLGLDTEDKVWLGWVNLQNLLVGRYDKESWPMSNGWLEVELKRDYWFRCEYLGTRTLPDGTVEEVELKDDLPFRKVVAYAPINAADPVAVARTMAAQTVRLSEFGEFSVLPYDPQKKSYASTRINTHNRVTMQTPWRQCPA